MLANPQFHQQLVISTSICFVSAFRKKSFWQRVVKNLVCLTIGNRFAKNYFCFNNVEQYVNKCLGVGHLNFGLVKQKSTKGKTILVTCAVIIHAKRYIYFDTWFKSYSFLTYIIPYFTASFVVNYFHIDYMYSFLPLPYNS